MFVFVINEIREVGIETPPCRVCLLSNWTNQISLLSFYWKGECNSRKKYQALPKYVNIIPFFLLCLNIHFSLDRFKYMLFYSLIIK